MVVRWLRRLVLLALLTVLSPALAQDGDKKLQPDEDLSETPTDKVQAVLDVGGHTGTIQDLVFGKGGKRLYTVGEPGDLHEWDVESGERLRVWRFPEPAERLALAPDGKQLAVGGLRRPGPVRQARASVWLVNLETGEARVKGLVEGLGVFGLAFSPDGKRLVAGAGPTVNLLSLSADGPAAKLFPTGLLFSLAFNKDGTRLLASGYAGKAERRFVRIFDLGPDGGQAVETFTRPGGIHPKAAWSPTGTHLACITGGKSPSFRAWTLGKQKRPLDWVVEKEELVKVLGQQVNASPDKERPDGLWWYPLGVVFRSETEGLACWEYAGWVRIFRYHLDQKTLELLPSAIPRQSHNSGMALSDDGRLLAVTTNPAHRIVVYDLNEGKSRPYRHWGAEEALLADQGSGVPPLPSFGTEVRRPHFVGWTPDGKSIVWSYQHPPAQKSLNLHTLKLVPARDDTGSLPEGWKLELDSSHQTVLTRPGQKDVPLSLGDVVPGLARAFTNQAGRLRLLVTHNFGARLSIVDPDTGKFESRVGKRFSPVYDLAVSPDHKYVLVAGGGLTLDVFSLAQPMKPMLQVLADRRNWVAWTPEGYYAGTPGGERWLGWKVAPSEEQLAQFYPVQAFKRTFYHPEVIQELLAAGSLKAAVARTSKDLVARDIQTVPPPSVEITARQDPWDKGKWTIRARAQFARGQEVQRMRLYVDGRPVSEADATSSFQRQQTEAEAEWVIPRMAEGEKVELKVLARCPDVSAFSPVLRIDTLPPEKRPVLHLVCIGLNYGNRHPAPQLKCPENDAQAVARAFAETCVGRDNLFEQARTHLLLGPQATTASIRAELLQVRKEVKTARRDLVVFFFAGHGVREKQQFYLITQDAQLNNLAKTALSGEDLRRAFADCPCRVLVLLDACHSATAGLFLGKKGWQAATDGAARDLSDEECEVTLLAAALGNEEALEPRGGKNGLFTQALLRTLQEKGSVLYNRFDGRQYVHHLHTAVLDQVQHDSEDKQHPFLSLPWTIESFPVRAIR